MLRKLMLLNVCLSYAYLEKCEQLRADVNINCRKLPTMYWIPKLHKTPYKARFIANSSSCTTIVRTN